MMDSKQRADAVSKQNIETSASTSIRAHIAEQQWGGFVSDFWTYFKSVADMNAKVAANPAWSVIEHEVVTW